MQKISHTGEGESKDEQDDVSLDQTALNQTELQHLHSEKLIEAINDIKVQIQKLKIDTKENQTSISKLTALSQVAHPKPDESFELHKLRQENEDYRCQNENLLRENAEKTESMNNLAYDRTSRPSGHFLAVICRSNQAKRTSTTESLYVFTMWKTRPHCSRVSQFKPTPRPFQRAMLRMREVRTLRPLM